MEKSTQISQSALKACQPISIEKRLQRCEAKIRQLTRKFYETANLEYVLKIEQEEEKVKNYTALLAYIACNAITQENLVKKRASHIFAEGSFHPIKRIEKRCVTVFYVFNNACIEKSFAYHQIESFKTLQKFCSEFDISNLQLVKPAVSFTLAGCIQVSF